MADGIRLLYVDDESGLLQIAQLFLEKSGEFKVETLTSAQEALDSSSIQSCDAIISDFQMPEMDGIAFLKAVRERFGDLPFILFTGRGREEVVIDAINNGVDFYLQKGGEFQAQLRNWHIRSDRRLIGDGPITSVRSPRNGFLISSISFPMPRLPLTGPVF